MCKNFPIIKSLGRMPETFKKMHHQNISSVIFIETCIKVIFLPNIQYTMSDKKHRDWLYNNSTTTRINSALIPFRTIYFIQYRFC